jgi:hypothetical protein|tara:strand:- start:1045 stop:1185 length:141 start_codon:yes stop_codon:yes gene_type:complete
MDLDRKTNKIFDEVNKKIKDNFELQKNNLSNDVDKIKKITKQKVNN